MEKHIEELNAKAEPEPLIVRGDSVEINITGKFPEKYFHKKVIVEATPRSEKKTSALQSLTKLE